MRRRSLRVSSGLARASVGVASRDRLPLATPSGLRGANPVRDTTHYLPARPSQKTTATPISKALARSYRFSGSYAHHLPCARSDHRLKGSSTHGNPKFRNFPSRPGRRISNHPVITQPRCALSGAYPPTTPGRPQTQYLRNRVSRHNGTCRRARSGFSSTSSPISPRRRLP
jgi:hypothetical protein